MAPACSVQSFALLLNEWFIIVSVGIIIYILSPFLIQYAYASCKDFHVKLYVRYSLLNQTYAHTHIKSCINSTFTRNTALNKAGVVSMAYFSMVLSGLNQFLGNVGSALTVPFYVLILCIMLFGSRGQSL